AGCLVLLVVTKVREAESAIDIRRLTGKVFFIREDWETGQRSHISSHIVVMNANGTDSRILTEEITPMNPGLGSLFVWASGDETKHFGSGLYTLRVVGRSPNLSVVG